jgi:hypothetical protein
MLNDKRYHQMQNLRKLAASIWNAGKFKEDSSIGYAP